MIYTFRTFPAIDQLRKLDNDVFVFAKLKEDLARLEEILVTQKPDYILGVAITKGPSRLEPMAVNQFNHGKVMHGGPDALKLYVPPSLPTGFIIAKKPTHSFCNWTMFRAQSLIIQKGLQTKFVFLHLNPADAARLSVLLAHLA